MQYAVATSAKTLDFFIVYEQSMLLTSAKQQHENPENGEPTNATVDSCFDLFGPRQCSVAPGVDQLLADVLLILFGTYTCMGAPQCASM